MYELDGAPGIVDPAQGSRDAKDIIDRALEEAKRIRLAALRAAEQNHRSMITAAQRACDEMVSAARKEAAVIVEAARLEVDRVKATGGGEGGSSADDDRSPAHEVLEIALEDSRQLRLAALKEAQSLHEDMVASAKAEAAEIVRQAETKADDVMDEARDAVEMMRAEVQKLYDQMAVLVRRCHEIDRPVRRVEREAPGEAAARSEERVIPSALASDLWPSRPIEPTSRPTPVAGIYHTPAAQASDNGSHRFGEATDEMPTPAPEETPAADEQRVSVEWSTWDGSAAATDEEPKPAAAAEGSGAESTEDGPVEERPAASERSEAEDAVAGVEAEELEPARYHSNGHQPNEDGAAGRDAVTPYVGSGVYGGIEVDGSREAERPAASVEPAGEGRDSTDRFTRSLTPPGRPSLLSTLSKGPHTTGIRRLLSPGGSSGTLLGHLERAADETD